jgi:hypothetical protein
VARRLFRVPRASGLKWDACHIKINYKPSITYKVWDYDFGKGLGNNTKMFMKGCYS